LFEKTYDRAGRIPTIERRKKPQKLAPKTVRQQTKNQGKQPANSVDEA
jgi:hypothetical protein